MAAASQAVFVGRSLEQARGAEGEPVHRGATTHPGKKDAMGTNARKTVLLGDLVVAAFDIAAQYSCDPLVVSLLATRTVMRVLRPDHTGPPFRQAAGFLPCGGSRELLALEGAGRQPRAWTIPGGGADR